MPAQRSSQTGYRAKLAAIDLRQPWGPFPQPRTQAATNSLYQPPDPFPFDPSQSPDPQFESTLTVDTGDEASLHSEPFAPDFPLPNIANHGATHGATVEDVDRDTCSSEQARLHSAKLEMLDLNEWDENETYDEDPPRCLHYSMEWKVALNSKVILKDTEPDLVLAPRFYWSLFLRPKLEGLLQKKLPHKRVTCDDTNVVVSVTRHSERSLTKRFDETDIDWFVIERQLLAWGELFRAGKKLRINLSFNYLEVGQQMPTTLRRAGKRGHPSATQRMLTERALQLDTEEQTTGQPSIWREVYNLMRCPGPPCHLGPYCWQDPVGKKHYKLYTLQLKGLIRYVEQGGQLRTHDDVPEDIRQQLYAEEQQQVERQQKTTKASVPSLPPITITNVLPGTPHSIATQPVVTPSTPRLVIPGFLDTALEEYSGWQQSRVRSESRKADI